MGELQTDMVSLSEMETIKTTETLRESTFLVPFFNFFYYLLLIPFKVTLDPATNLYRLKSSLANRILCGIAHVLVFVSFSYMIAAAIVFFLSNKESIIVLAFHLASNFSALVAYAIIINLLWRRQDDFLWVIEWTRVPRQLICVNKGLLIAGILIYATLFFLFAFLSIMNWNWLAIHQNAHLSFLSISELEQSRSTNGENSTFVGNNTNGFMNNKGNAKLLKGIILGLIIYASIFYFTVQGILLALTLSLRQLGKQFSVQMDKCIRKVECFPSEIGESIEKGIQCYRELKRISEGIQRVYGNHLMAYYVTSVSYYAEAPHVLLGKRGEMERVVLVYFVVSGVVWILAAEFHDTVRKIMLKWIRVHTESKLVTIEDRLKLLAISNEISSDPIALSSKCFRVTYIHIGTMLKIILAYGIIICQLHTNSS